MCRYFTVGDHIPGKLVQSMHEMKMYALETNDFYSEDINFILWYRIAD